MKEAHYDYAGIVSTLNINDAFNFDTGGPHKLILVRNKEPLRNKSAIGAVTLANVSRAMLLMRILCLSNCTLQMFGDLLGSCHAFAVGALGEQSYFS